MRIMATIAFTMILLFGLQAGAQACPGVDQVLTAGRLKTFQSRISVLVSQSRAPAKVDVQHFMSMGEWTAVFATPKGEERGVFFFRTEHGVPKHVDTWGGVAGPDTVDSIAGWTTKMSPSFPHPLSLCFAKSVKAGN
jgi:hypothetical protein